MGQYFPPGVNLGRLVELLNADRVGPHLEQQAASLVIGDYPLTLTKDSPTFWQLPSTGLTTNPEVFLPPRAEVLGRVYTFLRLGEDTQYEIAVQPALGSSDEIGAGHTDSVSSVVLPISLRREGDLVQVFASRDRWEVLARHHEQEWYLSGISAPGIHQQIPEHVGFVYLTGGGGTETHADLPPISGFSNCTADELVVVRANDDGTPHMLHAHADDAIEDGTTGGTMVIAGKQTIRLKPVLSAVGAHRWWIV